MHPTDDPFTDDLFAAPASTALVEPPAPPAPPAPSAADDDSLPLGDYAERCYLAYAMSVVKGRALPTWKTA
jgi:topoisomerase-4 subunit A